MEHMIKKTNGAGSHNKITIKSIYNGNDDEHSYNTTRCNQNEIYCSLHSSPLKTITTKTKTVATVLKTLNNHQNNNNNNNNNSNSSSMNGCHHLANNEPAYKLREKTKSRSQNSKSSDYNRQLKAISTMYVSNRTISNKKASTSNYHLFNCNVNEKINNTNNKNDRRTICICEQQQQPETTPVRDRQLSQISPQHLIVSPTSAAMLPRSKLNLSWTQRWTKWFSACGTDKENLPSNTINNPIVKISPTIIAGVSEV
ncbi:unnamed protein product [Didymodactylos carnosus]|uniref:Uncharacterized protein n=1 Tax=Didymodactylos carnosus TaxID=1234261 RepID=A0A8S2P969_9BILA|nr:unnamed protein product [Didymodactylos carnosus]CAF4042855.1 unnamed protein product [Didymodactylos carnosus]